MLKRVKMKIYICIASVILLMCITCGKIANQKVLLTNSNGVLSNKKICWGIKRADNHEQPDVGKENKELMEKTGSYYMGNPEKKYVYLTFDAGYEAGYTERILETLKENDVKACFFITGHYLNTKPELVEKMIESGNIVGNHSPYLLMEL